MAESVITERQPFSEDVKFRRASIADLNALVYICRVCFPEYYRWQSLVPVGRKWWKVVLESEASQIWVVEDSKGIFAFNVLVLDLELWKAESKARNGSLMFRLLAPLCCPFPTVWRRLWKVALVRVTTRKTVIHNVKKRSSERIAWSEMIGVLPRLRRKGMSSWLLRATNQKLREAGANTIETHIDSDNVPSRRMHEKMGYVLISEDLRGCLYRKSLVDVVRQSRDDAKN